MRCYVPMSRLVPVGREKSVSVSELSCTSCGLDSLSFNKDQKTTPLSPPILINILKCI